MNLKWSERIEEVFSNTISCFLREPVFVNLPFSSDAYTAAETKLFAPTHSGE